jgi:AraC family transcriptional regulator of arabinose operon
MSPQQYLMQYKLKKARELLMDTDLPIQDIAMQVGYDNPLTFSKIFKNYYGESPRMYRLRKAKPD